MQGNAEDGVGLIVESAAKALSTRMPPVCFFPFRIEASCGTGCLRPFDIFSAACDLLDMLHDVADPCNAANSPPQELAVLPSGDGRD